jgi:phosphoketolase
LQFEGIISFAPAPRATLESPVDQAELVKLDAYRRACCYLVAGMICTIIRCC